LDSASDATYTYLEERLTYPYYFIGRKKPKKDLPIGKSDYRCGMKGRRGSFIVEAKKLDHILTDEDREQAHSYAAHAQVGANYFVLCNGSRFEIYETLAGDYKTPILSRDCKGLMEKFDDVENILAPRQLVKNCSVIYQPGQRLSNSFGPAENKRGLPSNEIWRQ